MFSVSVRLFVGLCICTHPAIIMSCTLLPCDFILFDLTTALQFKYSTGVATMSNLAQIQVRHTYLGAEAT